MQINEDRTAEVVPRDYSYVFNPYREPIATVMPGERVAIHTDDAFESRITKKEDLPSRALATAKFLNPQTGPIHVEGAEPGDTLAVRIEMIRAYKGLRRKRLDTLLRRPDLDKLHPDSSGAAA